MLLQGVDVNAIVVSAVCWIQQDTSCCVCRIFLLHVTEQDTFSRQKNVARRIEKQDTFGLSSSLRYHDHPLMLMMIIHSSMQE